MPDRNDTQNTTSLEAGVERLDVMVREVRERYHENSNAGALQQAQSPVETWSKKFLSEGFGPVAAFMPLDGAPPATHQHQLMAELRACVPTARKEGKRPRPYQPSAPMRPMMLQRSQPKSFFARMFSE